MDISHLKYNSLSGFLLLWSSSLALSPPLLFPLISSSPSREKERWLHTFSSLSLSLFIGFNNTTVALVLSCVCVSLSLCLSPSFSCCGFFVHTRQRIHIFSISTRRHQSRTYPSNRRLFNSLVVCMSSFGTLHDILISPHWIKSRSLFSHRSTTPMLLLLPFLLWRWLTYRVSNSCRHYCIQLTKHQTHIRLNDRSSHLLRLVNMPIDKRKMTNTTNESTWLSSMFASSHSLYLLLIFLSLAWNAYNTHQYQTLLTRQSKLERALEELGVSVVEPIPSSPIEQWFTKVFALIPQWSGNEAPNSANQDFKAQSTMVRFVLLEMPLESLDTCVWKCMCVCVVLVKATFA